MAAAQLPSGRPMLILSPHLDDAWLSASALIGPADTHVWTVFAGEPDPAQRTPWDTTCGFADSAETMAARRAEDDAAFADVASTVRHLPYLEAAYADGALRRAQARGLRDDVAEWLDEHPDGVLALPVCAGVHVAPALWEKLRDQVRRDDLRTHDAPAPATETPQPTPVNPAPQDVKTQAVRIVQRTMHADHQRRRRKAQRRGMAANPDHVLVRDTALAVAHQRGVDLLFWEDLPYLWHERGAGQARQVATRWGLDLQQIDVPIDVDSKYLQVQHYRSQLDVLDPQQQRLSRPGHLPATETFWSARPKGTHD